jgi:uncharacterized membrane protein
MIVSKFRKNDESDRPKVRPEMMPVDWLLEGVVICLLFTFVGFAIFWYNSAPEIVPTHFNARGEIDDYGSRINLLVLPAMGVGIYLLMTIINLFPYRFNFLQKITPANAMRQYLFATRFIRILKLVVLGIFFLIETMVAGSMHEQQSKPQFWLVPVILGSVFIPMIIYFIVSSRK